MIPEISELEEGYAPPCIEMEIAGRQMKIFKMTLASFERAMKVIEPYVDKIFQEFMGLDIFAKAAQGKELSKIEKKGAEAQVKEVFRTKFGDLVMRVPRTAVHLVACIMNIPEEGEITEFFWNAMSPGDLFEVIERLDELNDFAKIANRLFDLIRYFGKKYGISVSGEIVNKE